jgi:CubicO group peptidase (beta-lactamase class C family)
MKNYFLWIVLIFGAGRLMAQPDKDLVDSVFSLGFSGVVLVAEKGKPLLYSVNGYRNFEKNIALKKTDIFEFASVSKQFTAMVIMMLKEAGKLSFDDPVANYLEVPYSGISIRHLLTHTSGLPDYQAIMDVHWDKSKVAGNPDIIAYLNKYAPPKRFEPGEKYEYSNTGYVLLASIAEKASGEDFITFIRKRIFKPLKMKDTDIRTLEEKAAEKQFAAGHLLDSSGNYVNANRFHASDYTIWLGNRKGPGRVSGTAADLLKWDQALYSQKLVSQKTLDEAFSPMKLNDGSLSNYGFGWDLSHSSARVRVVSHTGDNPGYKTIIVRQLDERKTIIILNNNAHPAMRLLVDKSVWIE